MPTTTQTGNILRPRAQLLHPPRKRSTGGIQPPVPSGNNGILSDPPQLDQQAPQEFDDISYPAQDNSQLISQNVETEQQQNIKEMSAQQKLLDWYLLCKTIVYLILFSHFFDYFHVCWCNKCNPLKGDSGIVYIRKEIIWKKILSYKLKGLVKG